jgi:polar amino acid transport system substrate-binding protein
MIYWKSGLVRALTFSLLALSGALVSAQTVTIGAEDDWAPYSSKVGGDAKGFAVDVVREAFKAAGIDANFVAVPYVRCMAMAKSGEVAGCFDAARNSELEADYLWHAKPLFKAKVNIYALAESKESNLTIKSLEGKAVGVTNSYEYGEQFDSNKLIKKDAANQDELGFKKLMAGRFPYMVAYELPANAVFAKNKEFAGKFKPVGLVAAPDLYIAFSKKHPDGAKVVAKFNEGFESIVKSGKYKALEDRWK